MWSTGSTSRPPRAATRALKDAGKDKGVLIVAIDGGCPGVKNVASGIFGATSQQYPLKMASMGVEAIAQFVKTGKKPAKTPGLQFTDTGATLVTDKPVVGCAVDHQCRRP